MELSYLKNLRAVKIVWFVLRVLVNAAVFALSGYLLWKYEYWQQMPAVDHIVGVLPISFLLAITIAATILLWIRHEKRTRALCLTLAGTIFLLAVLFPNALRGNWWLGKEDKSGVDLDVSVYAPFTEGNQTASLDEESTLRLTSDLPVMDGALALYPVYSAVAETVYDPSAYDGQVTFTNTLRAFDGIIAGERDIIFSARPSANQTKAAKEAGVELCLTPIGKEAFVFLVGASNPVEDISYQQIKNIYSGKTKKWRTLGWKEGGDILAFQRPEGSGSQTGLQSIMKDFPIVAPQPLPDKSLIGSNSLMQQISVEWKGVQPALGYSYRFFATTMIPNENAKLLSVNSVAPTKENIQSGAYPFTTNFYAITNGDPTGNTKKLIDWLLSEQGQELIERCGYVRL